MYVQLGDSFVVPFNVADATGASVVADSLPTALVVVAGTGIIGYTPAVTHLTNGDYYVTVACTGGNGFTLNQACGLWVHATLSSVVGSIGLETFNISGTLPTTSTLVNAILDELLSGHAVIGSVGDGIAIAAGLAQGNFLLDNTDNTNPNGQTSARIRVFRSSSATSSATPGGTGEGEFATFLLTTTYSGPNKVITHRAVRQ